MSDLILWSDLPVGGVAFQEPADEFPFLIRLSCGFVWLRDELDRDFGWSDGTDFEFYDEPPRVHVLATGVRSEREARAVISEHRERAARSGQ